MTGDPKVYMEIKRGENILLGKKGLESWQKTKNEKLAQLILSVILQRPGTARSSKNTIWADKKTYSAIFFNKREKDTLVDLLQLSELYESWMNDNKHFSKDEMTAAKNGKFFVLALVGFLIKYSRKQIGKNPKTWINEISQGEIEGALLIKDRENDKPLFSLFNMLVVHLSKQYADNPDKFSAFANLTKLDSNYSGIILSTLEEKYFRSDYDFADLKKRIDETFIV